ncbi:MAG: hypothetical protein IH872_05935 [Chloroflexi bacterium]|nr:hypothetical protein [Chloroflexota bacterium]
MCSVHDTVEFEKRGIPSTTIITAAFKKAADFQFRGKGMQGHPYVVLPHPVSNLQPNEVRELALRFVDEVAGYLKS